MQFVTSRGNIEGGKEDGFCVRIQWDQKTMGCIQSAERKNKSVVFHLFTDIVASVGLICKRTKTNAFLNKEGKTWSIEYNQN